MLFLTIMAIVALTSLPTPSASQEASTTVPLPLPARVINTNEQVCPSDEVREMVLDEINQDILNTIRNTVIPALCGGQTRASPATSCSALPTSCSSDYYWIRSSNGTAVQVYCDMDRVRTCGCSSTGGWTRVANLNMRDPSQQCPGDWTLQNYNSEPMRLCGRGSSGAGCLSAVYSTYGISYSRVCGRVTGYQYGSADALSQAEGSQTIEGPYVDGVSVTHGSPGPRQHIWSFAAGISQSFILFSSTASCPCVSGRVVPSYVGNDYFCESGYAGLFPTSVLYTNDPLWDGQGCGLLSCCEMSSPPGVTAPWFCKELPQATTDDIEVRICGDELASNEDTPVELLELYIR